MADLLAAFLIGSLVGLLARPVVDAYLLWRWARMWAELPADEAQLFDESDLRHPAP